MKKREENKKYLTYISLFSGGGVGCFGFKQNDFSCVATNEIIQRRLDVQKYNNICEYQSGYISGDIKKEETKEAIFQEIKKWKNKRRIKEIDILIATPPCQGMSVANHKKNNEIGRNSLIVESIKLTKEINPRFFIFENVKSFLSTICTDLDGVDRTIKESIERNLSSDYNILCRYINFKDYGNNSSRTRTIVLGVRKNIKDITPYDIFPDKKDGKTIREIIGDLPRLKVMGEINENDIYHNFKPYQEHMLHWIKDLNEGESAFHNRDQKKVPHRVVNGKIIRNKNKNGDKYRRCYWDKIAPCIHTRNDILASQLTIHPEDSRVFSIRELMKLMTIPNSFRWVDSSNNEINKLTLDEKKDLLKKNEINIRQCIGEGVPTVIFKNIAGKIKNIERKKSLNLGQIKELIKEKKLNNSNSLKNYIKDNFKDYHFSNLFKIAELANLQRTNHSAYYTDPSICFSLVKELPEFKNREKIRIIEPAAGVGNFLPLIFKKYENIKEVELDVVDIDKNALDILKILIKRNGLPKNFKINFFENDFLLRDFNEKYDVVVGNPPFGKIVNSKELLKRYKVDKYNKKTNNICSYFIEKSLKISNLVALILPKSLLSSPEFDGTRDLLSRYNLKTIIDYGEKAFQGVKIETISIVLENKKSKPDNFVKIESYITNNTCFKRQDYILSKEFPYWLIYRDSFFDNINNKLEKNIFKVFRDRKITKRITKESGKIKVLKARNIGSNVIIKRDGYDTYIDNIENLPVAHFINQENIVLFPNLTYNPRACFLPKRAIADGSVAILIPRENKKVSKKDLEYYNTKEFKEFYIIARNRGSRSLNIDNNSVFFLGKIKN